MTIHFLSQLKLTQTLCVTPYKPHFCIISTQNPQEKGIGSHFLTQYFLFWAFPSWFYELLFWFAMGWWFRCWVLSVYGLLIDLYLFHLNSLCLVDLKWLSFVCCYILIWFCVCISCVCFCLEYFKSFHTHQDMSHWHMFVLWVMLYSTTLELFYKMLSVLEFLPMGTLIWVVGLWL